MISSGLGGLAHVMVEMTVPGQRRMALTPSFTPITRQLDAKKCISRSISTISSDTGISEQMNEKPHTEGRLRNKLSSFFESRKQATKSYIHDNEEDIHENNSYRLASSPNLSTVEDNRISHGMRTALLPHSAIAPALLQAGRHNAQELPEIVCHVQNSAYDPYSMQLMDDRQKQQKKHLTRRKSRDRSRDKLSLSDRNIPTRVKNGSASSPLFKRIVKFGKSRSNKHLHRTDSTESNRLLHVVGDSSPDSANYLAHGDSSVNILITDVDSEVDSVDFHHRNDKGLINGRHSLPGRGERSCSLLQNPFTDNSE